MKLIPQNFKANGYGYNLLKRKGNVALYEQYQIEGVVDGYELHIIREQKANTTRYGGVEIKYEHKEKLAGNNAFGQYGWSILSKEMALFMFDKLVLQEQKKDGGKVK